MLTEGSHPKRGSSTFRRVRAWGILAVVAGAAIILWGKLEWLRPTAVLVEPPIYLGEETLVAVDFEESGTGIEAVEVFLETTERTFPIVSETFPRQSWWGSGVLRHSVRVPFDARERGVPEGDATLVVRATDSSWMNLFRSPSDTLRHDVIVDTTLPDVFSITGRVYARAGGSAAVVFRTEEDADEAGVEIGELRIPAVGGVLPDSRARFAIVPIPVDATPSTEIVAYAVDRARNRNETRLDVVVQAAAYRERTIEVGDAFLSTKIPPLLERAEREIPEDLVEAYLIVNRDLRRESEERIREVTSRSHPLPLWSEPFLRQPGSATLSKFADLRTYLHDGREIDRQRHMGVDLASLQRAEVPASNRGIVVFTGSLGIYGETVIVDHGAGLFSLYGHLSTIEVSEGEEAERGAILGRTGATGLAGGDHLHFGINVRGHHVDPVEWWDPRWIETHVVGPVKDAGGTWPLD